MARPGNKRRALALVDRFAVYAIGGALAGSMPIPVLPHRIVRRLRAALAHDVCAEHGIALTPEARLLLADPRPPQRRRSVARDALQFMMTRTLARFTGVGAIYGPVRSGFEMLAFGRLLERYLELYRVAPSRAHALRMEAEEAAVIRAKIDDAIARVLRPGLESHITPKLLPSEDHRSTVDRAVDGAIIGASRLPEALARRLDAALDEICGGAKGEKDDGGEAS